MRSLTEDDIRDAMVNASPDDLRLLAVPIGVMLVDWDHTDFYAWIDPSTRSRGYLVAEIDGEPRGIVLRRANGSSTARAAMCNLCHTMQPPDQVALFSARRAGEAGENGDTVGIYICSDLSCHENVRLAAPLAPNEIRASVDRRIDGTRQRTEAFVSRVLETAGSRR